MSSTTTKSTIALLVLTVALAGCGTLEEAAREGAREAAREQIEATQESETTAVADEPEPEFTPEPEPEIQAAEGTYGSDPVLDRLQDECEDGNMDSCDSLFWDSPLNSEYEAFAQERRYSTDNDALTNEIANEMVSDDSMVEMMFDLVWADTSASDRDVTCEGYNMFGPEFAYDAFIGGWGDSPAPSISQFEEFFDGVC